MARYLAALSLVMAFGISCVHGWESGRATYYGTDGWSIHKGACGFGYQWPHVGTGFDVAAVADKAPIFSGSCGRCYEVKCDPQSQVLDGYGETFDRSSVCHDSSKTLVVRTVDNCPCDYPNNYYSNKRWCCYDHGITHFDLSIWAFEKLAEVKWGVMGIQYRQVPCSQAAENPAPAIDNPTPAEQPDGSMVLPSESTTYVKRFDSAGGTQGAVTVSYNTSSTPSSDVVSFSSTFQGGTSTEHSVSAFSGPSSSSPSPPPPPSSSSSPSSSGCSDTAPGDGTSCQQQKDWGKCEDGWLKDGDYCQQTCGHCWSDDSGSSASSGCYDTAPGDGTSCQQQKDWGKCEDGWLKDGNYCQQTCGHCSK